MPLFLKVRVQNSKQTLKVPAVLKIPNAIHFARRDNTLWLRKYFDINSHELFHTFVFLVTNRRAVTL
jgi:hypothetical protein